MGNWYGTCGISQLPILENDDVVLFLLEEHDSYGRLSDMNGFTQSNDLYDPICLPVFGKYADYGTIDRIDDNDNLVYNHMLHLLERHKEYEKEEVEFENLEELIRHIERGHFKKLKFMLVHRKLYDNLINNVGNKTLNQLESFVSTEGKVDRKTITYKENLLYEINNYENIMADIGYDEFQFVTPLSLHLNRYERWTNRKFSYYKDPKLFNDSFKKRMADFIIFNNVMETSRKLWIPQVGAGSQILGMDASKEIANFTIEHVKNYNDGYDL